MNEGSTTNLRSFQRRAARALRRAGALVLLLVLLASAGCGERKRGTGPQTGVVPTISGQAELQQTIRSAGDRLLLLDLYAEWCGPCRMLEPVLEELSAEHRDQVDVYKIDVDADPDIARRFGATGIPHVVFVRDGEVVHALSGLRSKDAYVRAIRRLAPEHETTSAEAPDGVLEDGVRTIVMTAGAFPGSLYVVRGDTVRLVIQQVSFAYSIHIPAFGISAAAVPGNDLEVEFVAREAGVFPFFCNGDCPAGDGVRQGDIVVVPYQGTEEASYRELSDAEARRLMAEADPVILDVRTPAEFYDGHLAGARLIPVQQLAARLGELDGLQDRQLLVYCRSGNRSTVAARMLIDNGFRNVNNLESGLMGWIRSGYEVVR